MSPIYELIGRYAEDPMVYVEATFADEAAKAALDLGLPVSRGYGEGGSLIPIEVREPSDAIKRLAGLSADPDDDRGLSGYVEWPPR